MMRKPTLNNIARTKRASNDQARANNDGKTVATKENATKEKRDLGGIPRTYDLQQLRGNSRKDSQEQAAEKAVEKKPLPSWLPLAVSVSLPLLFGMIINLIAAPTSSNVYRALLLPPFFPPSWIIEPISAALHIAMGFASYLIFKQPHSLKRSLALLLYVVQLALNFAWPLLFFRFELLLVSSLEVLALAIVAATAIDCFERVNKIAAWLMVPVFLCAAFACYMNVGVALLN